MALYHFGCTAAFCSCRLPLRICLGSIPPNLVSSLYIPSNLHLGLLCSSSLSAAHSLPVTLPPPLTNKHPNFVHAANSSSALHARLQRRRFKHTPAPTSSYHHHAPFPNQHGSGKLPAQRIALPAPSTTGFEAHTHINPTTLLLLARCRDPLPFLFLVPFSNPSARPLPDQRAVESHQTLPTSNYTFGPFCATRAPLLHPPPSLSPRIAAPLSPQHYCHRQTCVPSPVHAHSLNPTQPQKPSLPSCPGRSAVPSPAARPRPTRTHNFISACAACLAAVLLAQARTAALLHFWSPTMAL